MIAFDCINDLGFIMRIATHLVYYLGIIVPLLLIVLIVFDFFKVVIGKADEKEKSEAIGKATKRLIYAVIIFLIPTVIRFTFKEYERIVHGDNLGNPTDWISCWNYYYEQINK